MGFFESLYWLRKGGCNLKEKTITQNSSSGSSWHSDCRWPCGGQGSVLWKRHPQDTCAALARGEGQGCPVGVGSAEDFQGVQESLGSLAVPLPSPMQGGPQSWHFAAAAAAPSGRGEGGPAWLLLWKGWLWPAVSSRVDAWGFRSPPCQPPSPSDWPTSQGSCEAKTAVVRGRWFLENGPCHEATSQVTTWERAGREEKTLQPQKGNRRRGRGRWKQGWRLCLL